MGSLSVKWAFLGYISILFVGSCGVNASVIGNIQQVLQRIDILETRMLNDGTHIRLDTAYLRRALEKLEEQWGDSLEETDNELEPLPVDPSSDYHQELLKMTENILEQSMKLEETIGGVMDVVSFLPELAENVEEIRDRPRCVAEIKRPRSCLELLESGHTASGLYKIYPETWTEPIKVYCDQETDGGGWTVFQRREDGTVDFYRGWLDYKVGFGNLLGEFWLGNEYIHRLSGKCCHELRVDLGDFDGNKRYAKYSNFSVGPKSGNYVLTVAGYSGNSGDSLLLHSGHPFSTKDAGHDIYDKSCAQVYMGAWWYEGCHESNLNGQYLKGAHESYADGVNWYAWKEHHYSLKFAEMKLREKSMRK